MFSEIKAKIIFSLSHNFFLFKRLLINHSFLRRLLIVFWHIGGCVITYFIAYLLRFEWNLPTKDFFTFLYTLPFLCISCTIIYTVFRMHSGLWSYFSFNDLPKILLASVISVLTFLFLIAIFLKNYLPNIPRSVLVLEIIFLSLWASGGRYLVRLIYEHRSAKKANNINNTSRILIVGNLHDCDLLMRNNRRESIGRIVGIITDSIYENKMTLQGVPVYSKPIQDTGIIAAKKQADYVLILPPFNKPSQMNIIVESCSLAKIACQFRMIPSLTELTSGNIQVSCIKHVELEDLLGRGKRELDRSILKTCLANKKIMITGAGGSIGSELCRQIASYSPDTLLVFETNEFSLYTIEQELKGSYPSLNIIAFAGDIRHEEEVKSAINLAGGIDILYHAAAYKHVPLMEENVPACIRNNVIGTYRLAKTAEDCLVKRFVMISTDKAVRPTSIMGGSKRLAEKIISNRKNLSKTVFVAVRFGNVLGSSGSVVPLFKKQIKNGGPVTVTSPNMRRFFMTIPEAVDLVLQAGAIGDQGEIMVLEMGEPVIIADMARKLIELSGLVPNEDIKIEFTGLRSGEKEYEEIITEDENVARTPYDKIWVMKKDQNKAKSNDINIKLLEKYVLSNDEQSLRKLLAQYIPENMFL